MENDAMELALELEKDMRSRFGEADPQGKGFFFCINLEDYARRFQKSFSKESFTSFVHEVAKKASKDEGVVYSLIHQGESWSNHALKNAIFRVRYR